MPANKIADQLNKMHLVASDHLTVNVPSREALKE